MKRQSHRVSMHSQTNTKSCFFLFHVILFILIPCSLCSLPMIKVAQFSSNKKKKKNTLRVICNKRIPETEMKNSWQPPFTTYVSSKWPRLVLKNSAYRPERHKYVLGDSLDYNCFEEPAWILKHQNQLCDYLLDGSYEERGSMMLLMMAVPIAIMINGAYYLFTW